MPIMKTRRSVFLGTLPLRPAEVAAQLLDVYAPNAYLDALQAGVPVGVGADGYAAVATNIATYVGVIESAAKEGQGVNLHGLANKQITYIKGPCEFETDNFVTGVAYDEGNALGVGAGGKLGIAGSAAERIGTIMSPRGSGDNVTSIICLLD